MSERPEDLDVKTLESMLRELRPPSDSLDRAVLMYRAGQATARGWIWPTATLFSTTLSLVLSMALWLRPAPTIVYVVAPLDRNEQVADTPLSSSLTMDFESGAWSRYVHLQEQVLLHGLEGLPPPTRETDEDPFRIESLWNSL